MVSYCTNHGSIPGILRLNEASMDFVPTIHNPFEGTHNLLESREDMSFRVEYYDINRANVCQTPVPHGILRLEEDGCGTDYYLQVPLFDVGQRYFSMTGES